jgi:hypothetical protein
MCARVQKMRKEANLRKDDLVEICFDCPAPDSVLARVINAKSSYITSRLGRTPMAAAARPRRAVRLLRSEVDVRLVDLVEGKLVQKSEPLVLEILAGCPFVDEAAVRKVLPDSSLFDDVISYLHCLDMARLHAEAAAGATEIKVAFYNKAKGMNTANSPNPQRGIQSE